MSLSSKILCLNKHSIDMDMLWIKNTESPKGASNIPEDVSFKVSETVGDNYPLIEVNGYVFGEDEIKLLEFLESGNVPTIRVVIYDSSGAFTNKYYPTSNALMKIYIKSKNQNLKAIRCDFLITDIRGVGNSRVDAGGSEGRNIQYTFTGTLNVPLLTDSVISAKKGTSFDTLYSISKQIKLGFATNELTTNDDMIWIQPNATCAEYISNITAHAYKDENSFFTSFIDRYYNFTFINLYNMMAQDNDFDVAYFEGTRDHESWYKSGGSIKSDHKTDTVPNQLSNKSDFRGSLSYISNYYMKSNQGKIMMNIPSTEHIYYYDYNISNETSKKFVDYVISSHDTMKSKEDVNKNSTNEWYGIDSGNIHDNYFFASKFNYRNNIEMNKTNMIVNTDGVNLNLLRGMRIPVSIWKEGIDKEFTEDTTTQTQENATDDSSKYKNERMQIEYDKKLSGLYIINALKFKYDSSIQGGTRWSTEALLSRATWEPNLEYSN